MKEREFEGKAADSLENESLRYRLCARRRILNLVPPRGSRCHLANRNLPMELKRAMIMGEIKWEI
jgi:hypothetical protein